MQQSTVSVSLNITTLADLRDFCKVLAGTEMVPKAYKSKPDDILVAMLHGQEVGLPHLQALQSIAVVNGIPSIYGDAALALVRASGKLEDFDEWIEVDGQRQEGPFPILKYADEGKTIVAYCRSKRVGMSRERVTSYSVDDARRAKLWEKKSSSGFESPWCTVPQRMLMWRARGWNLRDNFGDVLKGLAIYEEAMDIETSAGRDGVYRPVLIESKQREQQEDKEIEQLQQQLDEKLKANGNGMPKDATKDAPKDAPPAQPPTKPAESAAAPPGGSGGSQPPAPKGRPEQITDGQWIAITAYFDSTPELRAVKEAVKKTMKIDHMSLNAAGRLKFREEARAEAARRGVSLEVPK